MSYRSLSLPSHVSLHASQAFRPRILRAGILTLSLAAAGASDAGAAAPDTLRLESLTAVLELAEQQDPMLRALAADEKAITAARSDQRSLPNPELSVSSKQGGGERFGENAEVELHVNVGRILSTPWRFREADARARAARVRVEEARAARRFEVASAWHHAVAAQAVSDLEAAAASTWAAEAELARRRRGAGTLNALDLAETEAAAAAAHIAARRAARDALAARASLAGALGLQDTGAGPVPLRVAAALPPPEDDVVSASHARAGRIEQSAPSVRAARAEAEAARRSLETTRMAVLPRLTAGATWERDGRGATSLAPEVGVEVPLFNLGFARRKGARAGYEAATQRAAAHEAAFYARLDALDAAVAEARAAHAAWADTVLPLRRRAAAEALLHYNYMLVGADRLLAARREELAAERARVETLRDYWIARTARESLLGIASAGPVARGPSTAPGVPHAPPPPSPSSSPAPDHTHEPAQAPHAH